MFKQLGKDALIYGGGDLAAKLVAFITFPLIAAALSPKAFGTFELVMTAVALLGLIVNCGINNSVQRYYWDNHRTFAIQPVLVSTGIAVQLVFGVFAVFLGLCAMPSLLRLIDRVALPLSWIALISAFLLLPVQQLLQYILDVTRLHLAPLRFLAISFLSRVLSALAAFYVVVVWNFGLDGLLLAQALLTIAVIPIALWLIRKDLTREVSRALARELIQFGYPFIFTGMAYWLLGSMDRWMLAAISSIEETGIYSVAFRFASIVLFVSIAFGQAWSPYAIKIKTDHPGEYRAIYASVLLMLLFIMLMVGGIVALFSGELMAVIMPKNYVGSSLPLAILCFGVVLQATQQVTAIGISLEKKTFLFARLSWLTALVNFAGNWLLIPRYGAVGAAWATTFSYFVLTVSYLYFTQRLHPLPICKKSLGWLLFLGIGISTVSIIFNMTRVYSQILLLKALIVLAFVALALPVLPIKGCRLFNSVYIINCGKRVDGPTCSVDSRE